MPMPLYSFLETYDLSGKTIIPFNSHEGSRFSNTIKTIANLQPNATVIENGLTISRNDVVNCKETVIEWLHQLEK